MKCEYCEKDISPSANVCPHCGHKKLEEFSGKIPENKIAFLIGAVLTVLTLTWGSPPSPSPSLSSGIISSTILLLIAFLLFLFSLDFFEKLRKEILFLRKKMRQLGGVIDLQQILEDESAERSRSESGEVEAVEEIGRKIVNSIKIGKWGAYFFNIGTKILIAVFSILSYKYLLNYTIEIIALVVPIIFISFACIFSIIYRVITHEPVRGRELEREEGKRKKRRDLFELYLNIILGFCLIFILLDYFGILLIP